MRCCESSPAVDCVDALAVTILDAEETLGVTLTYDPQCMEELMEFADELDCAGDNSPACRLAYGTATHGDECEVIDDAAGFYISPCGDDLQCRSGRCVDRPFNDTQKATVGENCSSFLPCASELYCSGDMTCHPEADLGEACTEVTQCLPGLYCDGLLEGEGTCAPRLELDAPCDPRYELACDTAQTPEGSNQTLVCREGHCAFPGLDICEHGI